MTSPDAAADTPRRSSPLTAVQFYVRVLRYFTADWPYVLLTTAFIVLATFCALLDDPRILGIATTLLGDDFNYTGSDGNYYAITVGIRVLSNQCVRQRRPAQPLFQIGFVLFANPPQVVLERLAQHVRQHGDPIFLTFAVPDARKRNP